jgi:copper homeostasis protein CutC
MDGVAQVEDDASHELGTLAAGKRKRVLTEGRKKQNREAQRRFSESIKYSRRDSADAVH